MAPYEKSEALFKAASELMPGGVNSPVRAWQAVGLTPRSIVQGAGARVLDVDGNSYLDYVGSWGPLILGHAAPQVVAAVRRRRPGAPVSAPPRRGNWSWPGFCARRCPRSRWCAWSTPAPRPA